MPTNDRTNPADATATPPAEPTTERTPAAKALLWLGSLGPLGHMPASGTVTVLVVGVPMFYWMHTWPAWLYVTFSAAFILASVGIHQAGDRLLGEKDSRKLVWDELAGFWVAVAFVPFSLPIAGVAFFAERLIDIAKVPPGNWVEKHVPGGWGVVGDDLVAGLYTRLLLAAVVHWAPYWAGIATAPPAAG